MTTRFVVALVVLMASTAKAESGSSEGESGAIRSERPVMLSVVANSVTVGVQAGVNIAPYFAVEGLASTMFLISFLDIGVRGYLLDNWVSPFITARFSIPHYFHASGHGQDCASDPEFHDDCENEYPNPTSGLYVGVGVELTTDGGFNAFLSGGILKWLQKADRSYLPHGTLGIGYRF